MTEVYVVMGFTTETGIGPWQVMDSVWATHEGDYSRMFELRENMQRVSDDMAEEAPPDKEKFDELEEYIKAYASWTRNHFTASIRKMGVQDA